MLNTWKFDCTAFAGWTSKAALPISRHDFFCHQQRCQRSQSNSNLGTQPPTVVCKVETQLEYIHIAYTFFARLAPICKLSQCYIKKFLHCSSVESLLRVRCWLGTGTGDTSHPPPTTTPPSLCDTVDRCGEGGAVSQMATFTIQSVTWWAGLPLLASEWLEIAHFKKDVLFLGICVLNVGWS